MHFVLLRLEQLTHQLPLLRKSTDTAFVLLLKSGGILGILLKTYVRHAKVDLRCPSTDVKCNFSAPGLCLLLFRECRCPIGYILYLLKICGQESEVSLLLRLWLEPLKYNGNYFQQFYSLDYSSSSNNYRDVKRCQQQFCARLL